MEKQAQPSHNQADWLNADIKELFKLIMDTRALKPLLKPRG